MKIVGGSYGTTGSAYISLDNCLVLEATPKKVYRPGSAAKAAARIEKSKKFGCFGFVVGAVLISALLSLFLGIFGIVIGLIVAVAGSFYTQKDDYVEIEFKDGKTVSLQCTPRGVKQLIAWANT